MPAIDLLRIGSLFSGYEGLGRGVQMAMGGTLTWVSDIDPGPCKILAHRYPDVPNLGDVTTVDWTAVEPVDLICGGSPCQDLSTAGRRAGMRPGTRSGLWESMREAIAVIRPEWVVWENVRGSLSAEAHSDMVDNEGRVGDGQSGPVLRALGRVLGDLADLGFDAEWRGLRASDVGAPHGRYRIFVVAHTNGVRGPLPHRRGQSAVERSRRDGSTGRPMTLLPTPTAESSHDWGDYAAAITQWERITRPAPAPTEPGRNGPRLSPRLPEWMMGLPDGWICDVPGITRTEALKAAGNGVAPAQAAAAIADCVTAFLADISEG